MPTVSLHRKKTPVTRGSKGVAKAETPNVCKMPPPPAPFRPQNLSNTGKSGQSPKGYSKDVKIEGNATAIRGASFKSQGDMASKATGGGLVSMNTHGPTKFVAPGSLTVKIEGKNVHLLSDAMVNNCGPSGSPPNSATVDGIDQGTATAAALEDECKKIKDEFKLETASHKENEAKKSKSYQSHHVLQDAALKAKGCPSASGLAVLLADSFGGTEHGEITKRQNARRHNKKGGGAGALPAITYGELKQQAQADLVEGLAGRRKNKTGRPMTRQEAELAAKCLVAEADKTTKKAAKVNGKSINDKTKVTRPGGCFAAGTEVLLASGELRAVELLRTGDHIRTPGGTSKVVRVDGCRHDLVELVVGGAVITVASFHSLFDAEGPVRASLLRVGDFVATAQGLLSIEGLRRIPALVPVFRLGVAARGTCFLGPAGVFAEVVAAGPPVVRQELVVSFAPDPS